MTRFFYLVDHRLIALAMLLALIAACEIGRRLGFLKADKSEPLRALMGGVGAAMLGLLGLLLGFILSMAVDRWDQRHNVVVSEANAIGTLWLRAGLLGDPLRGELRDALRDYVESRIPQSGSREEIEDLSALRAARGRSEKLHGTIWSVVERADPSGASNAKVSSLITAANEIIDLHELRLASILNYLPPQIFLMLLGVAALSLGFLGWCFGAASQRNRSALLLLAILVSAFLLLLMDMNRPQRGSFEVGFAPLERVRDSMTEALP